MLLPVLVSGRGPDVETRTGTSYWLLLLWSLLLRVWIDWCDDWLVRPSQYATRLLCICGWLYYAYLCNYVCRPPTVSALVLVLCARSCLMHQGWNGRMIIIDVRVNYA